MDKGRKPEEMVPKGMEPVDPKKERRQFWKYFLIFYGLMLVLYLYFMLGNLSMAPKFVYTQF